MIEASAIQNRIDNLIRDLNEWKDNIVKRVNSSVSFDIIHNEIQVRETWQNGCAIRLNDLHERLRKFESVEDRPCEEMTPLDREHSLNKERAKCFSNCIDELRKNVSSIMFEISEIKEALRFLHNQKNYDLPSLVTLNKQVQDQLDKAKDDRKSYYENKIEVLMDCLDRKTMNIEALEQELKDERESHKCDIKNYEFRIKEMQQVIADRNKEIIDLRNPQVSPGNCT